MKRALMAEAQQQVHEKATRDRLAGLTAGAFSLEFTAPLKILTFFDGGKSGKYSFISFRKNR